MRKLLSGLAALAIYAAAAVAPALAADDEGTIASVDVEALTITLDNGNSYKLPLEFDVAALSEGMEIVLAYDTIDGEKLVTDLVTYD